MTLNTVTVTWNELDVGQAPLGGYVSFQLSAPAADSTDGLTIEPEPARTYFFTSATGTSAPLVANDNAQLAPAGSYYLVTVAIKGQQPYTFKTLVNFANGASQTLAFLYANQAQPAAQFAQYLPLPTGTATSGYVPIATGTGEASAWGPQSGGGGVTVQVPAPTGNTATDTPNVTAAITTLGTALGSGPATLQFQDGTYQVDGNALVLSGLSNFAIRGTGATQVNLAPNRTGAANNIYGNLLTVIGCTDFNISGIIFDGRRDQFAPIVPLTAAASSGQPSVTVASGAGANYLAGERMQLFGGNGSADSNKVDTVLTVSSITPGGGSGGGDLITFTTNLSNSYSAISATLLSDGFGPYSCPGAALMPYTVGTATVGGRTLSGEDQQNAIHLISCSRFRVTGNTCRNIWNSGIRMGTGFETTSLTDGCTDGRIEGNSIYHGFDQGIGAWVCSNITVTGNAVNSAGWGGCVLTQADDCTVTGNLLRNQQYYIPNDHNSGSGAVIEGGDRNLIAFNDCTGNTGQGVRIAQNPINYGLTLGSPATIANLGLAANSTTIQVSSSSAMSIGARYTIYDGARSETIFIATIVDSTHVTITKGTRFFHPQGAGIAQSGGTDNVIAGNNISGNGLSSQGTEGIGLWNAVRTIVSGNSITGNSHEGIIASRRGTGAASTGPYGSVITGNTITGNAQTQGGRQVTVDSAADLDISGNVLGGTYGNTSGNGIVQILGASTVTIRGNRIADGAGSGNGIYLAVGTVVANAPQKIRISENILERNFGDQLYANGTVTGLDISGNIIRDGFANGITLSTLSGAIVQGNRVTGNKTTGLSLASATSCTIANNTVADDGTGINPDSGTGAAQVQVNGIIESGSANNNLFTGNTCAGNSSAQLTIIGAASYQYANTLSGTVSPVPAALISQLASYAPTGLTGATAASAYGGGTASGAPASGTWTVGQFIVDQTGSFWICTTGGTPGTWTQVAGSGGGLTNPMTTLGDTIYGGASGVATRLAGNTSATAEILTSTGSGSAATAPAWATPASLGLLTSQVYGGMFGDGSDGTVAMNGSNTFAGFASLGGSTYTLTRDVFATSLTVSGGVTLATNGFRIFCTGTVTNGGTISSNGGNSATTGAGASPGNTNAMILSNAGAAGSTGAGTNGGFAGTMFGTGSSGTGGTGSGGSGGTSKSQNTSSWPLRNPVTALNVATVWNTSVKALSGGPGGSSGGGDGANNGGGGGGGGGLILIFAHAVTNTGTISAAGGNGGTPAAGNCGGGGGGGGGNIVAYTLSAWTAGTTSVAGGNAGSGVGTGTAGGSGTAGTVLNVVLA